MLLRLQVASLQRLGIQALRRKGIELVRTFKHGTESRGVQWGGYSSSVPTPFQVGAHLQPAALDLTPDTRTN